MSLRIQDALNQVSDSGTRFAFMQVFGWLKEIFDKHGHGSSESGVAVTLPFYLSNGTSSPITLSAAASGESGGTPINTETGDTAEFPEA